MMQSVLDFSTSIAAPSLPIYFYYSLFHIVLNHVAIFPFFKFIIKDYEIFVDYMEGTEVFKRRPPKIPEQIAQGRVSVCPIVTSLEMHLRFYFWIKKRIVVCIYII